MTFDSEVFRLRATAEKAGLTLSLSGNDSYVISELREEARKQISVMVAT
jgi:hypothetical protein